MSVSAEWTAVQYVVKDGEVVVVATASLEGMLATGAEVSLEEALAACSEAEDESK